MIEAGLEKLVEKFVREFTKDVCSLVRQNERIVFEPFLNHTLIEGCTILYIKVGCTFPIVISSEFRIGSIETATIGKTHPTSLLR